MMYKAFFMDMGVEEIMSEECAIYMSYFSTFILLPFILASILLTFCFTTFVLQLYTYIYLFIVWCAFVILFGEILTMTES
jgi:hypothetical protein